jgi:hypothetical protein
VRGTPAPGLAALLPATARARPGGTDAVTGEAASIERGYVRHRIDLKKVRVLDARAARCDQELGVCCGELLVEASRNSGHGHAWPGDAPRYPSAAASVWPPPPSWDFFWHHALGVPLGGGAGARSGLSADAPNERRRSGAPSRRP